MARRAPLVLEVDLSRELLEAPAASRWFRAAAPSLFEVVEAILRAARDSKIAGLLLRFDSPEIGWSKAESLHRAVRAFRESGKPSVAFLSRGASAAFLAASAADKLVLESTTTLDLVALSSESFFLKDVLAEFGIRPEIDQIGEYKAAAEVFLRNESSPAHRRQIDAILEDLQDVLVTGVAEGRRLARDAVAQELQRGPLLPEEAIASGLADVAADSEAVVTLLEEVLGAKPRLVGFRRYLTRGRLRRMVSRSRRRRIAVVHVAGIITLGESRRTGALRAAEARSLTELLAALRASRRVKAVVLRVDSPGGGAVASDRIRREIELLAMAKPVVISMGDVAASGGYYIATAAGTVMAEASTLTGSIGVIGGKFVVDRLLDRLGIYREVRATGPSAGFYSSFRSFRDDERARHRQFLAHFYEKKFVPAVASGRKISLDEADRLGRGRVWTGRQACERGLVDRLGGLHEAIDAACEQAGVARARARVSIVSPRRRLRDVVPLLVNEVRPSPLTALAEAAALVPELAQEEILLLMPRVFRIR